MIERSDAWAPYARRGHLTLGRTGNTTAEQVNSVVTAYLDGYGLLTGISMHEGLRTVNSSIRIRTRSVHDMCDVLSFLMLIEVEHRGAEVAAMDRFKACNTGDAVLCIKCT